VLFFIAAARARQVILRICAEYLEFFVGIRLADDPYHETTILGNDSPSQIIQNYLPHRPQLQSAGTKQRPERSLLVLEIRCRGGSYSSFASQVHSAAGLLQPLQTPSSMG
jgi:hypothetical protein